MPVFVVTPTGLTPPSLSAISSPLISPSPGGLKCGLPSGKNSPRSTTSGTPRDEESSARAAGEACAAEEREAAREEGGRERGRDTVGKRKVRPETTRGVGGAEEAGEDKGEEAGEDAGEEAGAEAGGEAGEVPSMVLR